MTILYTSRAVRKAALALGILIALTSPVQAADPNEFTQAENLLFVREHLKGISPATVIHYRYSRSGSLFKAMKDNAMLTLGGTTTKLDADVQFLSGKDKLNLPPFEGVKSNPLLLYFLEREIREMKRLTGGSTNYYRKRIRMALATDPKVQDVQINWNGKEINAKEITIAPYVDDPARARYEKYANKTIVFLLSDAVPGQLFSMRSELTSGAASSPVLWAETLSFDHRAN